MRIVDLRNYFYDKRSPMFNSIWDCFLLLLFYNIGYTVVFVVIVWRCCCCCYCLALLYYVLYLSVYGYCCYNWRYNIYYTHGEKWSMYLRLICQCLSYDRNLSLLYIFSRNHYFLFISHLTTIIESCSLLRDNYLYLCNIELGNLRKGLLTILFHMNETLHIR